MAYKIKFGLIKPTEISDKVIVKNPNYGTRIGEWGSREVTPNQDKQYLLKDFYQKLEESILREGFRNPIFCNSLEEGTFCRYGTSRLWIAKRHNLEIPAIIADYKDRWNTLEELFSEEEIRSKFNDQPKIIEITEQEMRIDACPHSHLQE